MPNFSGDSNCTKSSSEVEATTAEALKIIEKNDKLKEKVEEHVKDLLIGITPETSSSYIISRCGCLTVSLLDILLQHYRQPSNDESAPSNSSSESSMAPDGLVSLQQQRLIELCCTVVLYTSVLASLDSEGSIYTKMVIVKKKMVIGGSLDPCETGQRHKLLFNTMKIILPLYRHSELGRCVRKSLTGEVLVAALQLSYAPQHKVHSSDCQVIRHELQLTSDRVDPTIMLRNILLLKGIAATSAKRRWLLPVCSTLYKRQYLLKPPSQRPLGDGVKLVVRAALDITDGDDWRHCEAVAGLIARPSNVTDWDELYRIVCPQVVEVLLTPDAEKLCGVLRVMSLTASQLLERQPELSHKYLTCNLLHPLLSLTENYQAADEGVVDALWSSSVDSLERCVSVLYNTAVCAGGSCSALITPALGSLLAIAAVPPPCRTRHNAVCCIVKNLSNVNKSSECAERLLSMCGLQSASIILTVRRDVQLGIGEDGGVIQQTGSVNQASNPLDKVTWIADAVVRVLTQLKNPTVVKKFCCFLPKYIDFVAADVQPQPNKLMTLEDEAQESLDKFNNLFLSCELLSRILEEEKLLEGVFGSVSDGVPLLQQLLRCAAVPLCHDLELAQLQSSLLLNVLMSLKHLIKEHHSTQQLTSSDWDALQCLVPTLQQLQQKTQMNELAEDLVGQLQCTILTRAADDVSTEDIEQLREKLKLNPEDSKPLTQGVKKPLIEEITPLINNIKTEPDNINKNSNNEETLVGQEIKSEHTEVSVFSTANVVKAKNKRKAHSDGESDSEDGMEENKILDATISSGSSVFNPMATPDSGITGQILPLTSNGLGSLPPGFVPGQVCNNLPSSHMSSYSEAMEEVTSPILPVRGHALLSFSKLLDARDESALKNKKKLMTLFEQNMKDDDSYIYLMAVEGLAALCDAYPQKVVPLICKELNGNRSAADRAKLGEVLTRSARRLNTLLPQYKSEFLNALLTGVSDADEMVRAVCLSSLGEVCKELRFSISGELYTIMSTVVSVVSCDECVEPRRAAVLLVTLLLRGLGGDSIKLLKNIMRDIYRGLRHIVQCDKDEITRVHAGVALDEVDAIMKEFLMPKMATTKKIFITEASPRVFD